MEQLRPIIDAIRKYNFWIVLSLAVLVLLGFWWTSLSAFEDEFRSNAATISGKFNQLNQLRGKRPYPNNQWIRDVEELREEVDQQLARVARDNYEEQEKVRDWGDFTPGAKNASLKLEDLATYWTDYLPGQLDDMLEQLNASTNENDSGKLIWNSRNYNTIKSQLIPEVVRQRQEAQRLVDNESADPELVEGAKELLGTLEWPDTATVRKTQENLWVYRSLTNAIGKVNEGDDIDRYNLPIRTIEKIEIWPDADAKPNAVSNLGKNRVQRAGKGGTPGGGRGIPIPPVQSFYRVVPVRLTLEMEHHHISQLLVALANEPLTCEVVDVAMSNNPSYKVKAQEDPSPAAAPGGLGGAGLGGAGLGGVGLGGAGPASAAAPAVPKAQPRGKRVVVEALIYLAKPPRTAT
ncbi:MAG: hypothetical protein DWQ31_05865 [Planctomycetota bacterium]|nr:MAG: hypothetical protein DWQ31_05865 [Planctomycetota bacterium]REJ90257.1 MAG: hypothetical protein DWQ35_16380 [Planctomycetota bacterium]REK17768.1 MAG: hypothetical protein DWQ42_21450 [Planctomycetota bacterium]REK41002.1 MAG: hypothetical protein DWQ46_15060 [Planctomycetota bacterium]